MVHIKLTYKYTTRYKTIHNPVRKVAKTSFEKYEYLTNSKKPLSSIIEKKLTSKFISILNYTFTATAIFFAHRKLTILYNRIN